MGPGDATGPKKPRNAAASPAEEFREPLLAPKHTGKRAVLQAGVFPPIPPPCRAEGPFRVAPARGMSQPDSQGTAAS